MGALLLIASFRFFSEAFTASLWGSHEQIEGESNNKQ